MAADSQFGGGSTRPLNANSLELLNKFLADTVLTSILQRDLGNGAELTLGSGSHGEKQGAVAGPAAPITATMNDGVVFLTLALPKDVGFFFEGMDNQTPQGVSTFLRDMLDQYLGTPPVGTPAAAQKGALSAAITDLLEALTAQGAANIQVRVVDFLGIQGGGGATGAVGPNEVGFSAAGTPGTEVFAFNLAGLPHTLVVSDVANAALANAGVVRFEGNTAVRVVGDTFAQGITGGAGNDTLVGGGGHDTLTGGAGNDIFGFNALGHYRITDLNVAQDQLGIEFGGITNLSQLRAAVTSAVDTPTGLVVEFGKDMSITLVGVNSSQLTADMIKFSF